MMIPQGPMARQCSREQLYVAIIFSVVFVLLDLMENNIQRPLVFATTTTVQYPGTDCLYQRRRQTKEPSNINGIGNENETEAQRQMNGVSDTYGFYFAFAEIQRV